MNFAESAQQEIDRLASHPPGSKPALLSALPVTITAYPLDLVIELPLRAPDKRVVVVPVAYRGGAAEDSPRHRHVGWWECAIVASNEPAYQVGGYRFIISGAELARGTQIEV